MCPPSTMIRPVFPRLMPTATPLEVLAELLCDIGIT
jgi:hypothetical protein